MFKFKLIFVCVMFILSTFVYWTYEEMFVVIVIDYGQHMP